MENTYWNHNGRYQPLIDQLNKLVLSSGTVSAPALEKFRIASNCYYDLYNNGLCNRGAEFAKVFGFGGARIANQRYYTKTLYETDPGWQAFVSKVDAKMDKIILEAAKEQGFTRPGPATPIRSSQQHSMEFLEMPLTLDEAIVAAVINHERDVAEGMGWPGTVVADDQSEEDRIDTVRWAEALPRVVGSFLSIGKRNENLRDLVGWLQHDVHDMLIDYLNIEQIGKDAEGNGIFSDEDNARMDQGVKIAKAIAETLKLSITE